MKSSIFAHSIVKYRTSQAGELALKNAQNTRGPHRENQGCIQALQVLNIKTMPLIGLSPINLCPFACKCERNVVPLYPN